MLKIKKHKKTYAILLVNLLLLIIAIFLFRETEQVLKTDQEERQVAKINLHIDSVLISIKDAQLGNRGYIIYGEGSYLETFHNARKRLSTLVSGLETALNVQKDIKKKFVASERLMVNTLEKLDEIIKLKDEGANLEALAKRNREAKLYVDTLQNTIMAIEKYEKERLDYDAQIAVADLHKIVITLLISGIVIVLMVVLLSTNLVRDILKREELSLELDGSEKRYHFLFELSLDGILVANLNGTITDCNDAACKIFGYAKQDLIGQSYHRLFPEEQRKHLPSKVSHETVTGDKLVDTIYIRKDGTQIHAEVYTKIIEINGLSNVIAHIRDVSEKRLAQKAIAKSEEKYRQLFERSLAGIFRTTVNGEIIECNDEYARILGYKSADDIRDISTENIYADPSDRERLIALLKKEGAVKDLVMKLRKRNGANLWVYDSVEIMHDDELHKDILFGTLIDITAEKEAELLLAQSEKKYKDLVELLPQTVFEFDLNARITFTNKAGFELFGYTQEEFDKGLNVYQMIVPEEREKAKKNVEAEIIGIKQLNNEYTAVRKDGTTFPILIYSSPLLRDNKTVGIRGIVIDISERKKAESEVRMLAHSLESISECVSITDANNIFLYVNESFTKTYGFAKRELIGQHISVVQPRSIVSPAIQMEILNSTNQGGWKGELINKRKDGTEFPVYLSTSIVRDSQNAPIALIGVATDITERKLAEEALRLSEEKFNKAFQSSPIAMSLQNNESLFVDVNNAFLKLTAFSREEIIGHRGKDLQLWANATESKRANEFFVANGVIRDFEFMFRKKTGELGIGIMSAESIVLEGKKASLAAVLDITERKRAEEEIRRLNRIYTVLSNINQTIVRVKDKNQLLSTACKIAINDGKFKMAWIGLIDKQSGELKAVAADGFIDGYFDEGIFAGKNYPHGVTPVSEIIVTDKALIFNNIENLDAKTFWRMPALERGYKSNAVFPLKVFGKVIGNFSLFSDHTGYFEEKEIKLLEEMSEDISFALETMEIEKKRKESESLFLTLANTSPVGIFRTRADGYTTYVNPKWCQLSNMTAEEAIGDGWLDAVHPDDRKWLSDGWRSATDKKRSSVTEYRFLRHDGSIAWVMGQAIPELNSEGQIEGYVGTITDITKIKLYEQELIKAKELAEESDKLKSEFLAQISHEIRTPINVMVGSAVYLKDELEGLIDKELFPAFYSLDAAGKRIIRTVDLILNMAAIQTNSYHYTPEEINLSDPFLTIIYNEFISFAKEKNLEFNFHNRVMDAMIYADEYSVRQIFTHLLDNAIKYTNKGKVELILDRDIGDRVVVSIADTGIGMSKEFMDVMYKPFRQEEQGYSRRFEGNGLGLTLVKKYCDFNNAVISVQSEKEKGTIFRVSFKPNNK